MLYQLLFKSINPRDKEIKELKEEIKMLEYKLELALMFSSPNNQQIQQLKKNTTNLNGYQSMLNKTGESIDL